MKKWWNMLERSAERWFTREREIAICILLILVLLLGLWLKLGYPLPTTELAFHRLERTRLEPRSEIVYSSKRDDPVRWGDLPELSSYHDLIIGVRDGHVHVYEPDSDLFQCHSIGDGMTPVPLYDISNFWMPAHLISGTGILFPHVPEEAERAELEISGIDRYRKERHFREEGWRLAPGLWLFTAMVAEPGGYRHLDGWSIGGDYTLTLYRADGSVLAEQSGSFEGTHS